MASRTISKAESFELVYKAFQDINFKAFDFNTVKQSLIDYIRLYFPETFNDFIESSELIAHLEIFAYVAELFIYRVDVNAHENFLPVAQRKDSVLRLAKFISYNGSRNVAGRGLVKLKSIQTTEALFDARSRSLQNVTVTWNDQLNPSWKEQMVQIFNRISSNRFGNVNANERVQVQDVLFELYQLDNLPTDTGVLPFAVSAAGVSVAMECVPVVLTEAGPVERRPQGGQSQFSLVYGSDGLGDQSNMTGFFVMAKQGTLSRTRLQLDGRTPNQVIAIDNTNINETDVWVNQVDPTTGDIVDDGTNPTGRSGEWVSVNLENAENIIFNTLAYPNKFEVETRDNDRINVVFGDGEFAAIPGGTFDIWTRSSINDDIIIPKANIQDVTFTLRYRDERNQQHTITFVAGAVGPIQNSYKSEDIERIRKVAPSVYYTQDRMVNGRDYNSYLLRDPSILKLKAINRTFAGQSKYRAFTEFGGDPSETYDNVQLFGKDLAVYYQDSTFYQQVELFIDPVVLVNTNVEPILRDKDFYLCRLIHEYGDIDRLVFNDSIDLIFDPLDPTTAVPNFSDPVGNKLERTSILYALGSGVTVNGVTYINPNPSFPVKIYYDNNLNRWRTTTTSMFDPFAQVVDPEILIQIDRTVVGINKWVIQNVNTKLVAESNTTHFWNNTIDPIISFDSGNTSSDTIEILDVNRNARRDQLIDQAIVIPVAGQPLIDINYVAAGQTNIRQLLLDGVSPYTQSTAISPLIDPVYTFSGPFTAGQTITLPFYYIVGRGDIIIDSELVTQGPSNFGGTVSNQITVTSATLDQFTIKKLDYVYFQRTTVNDYWTIIDTVGPEALVSFVDDTDELYRRRRGRSGLNFLWRHYTDSYHLIDPAATNIVDILVLTKQYYVGMRRWLSGELNNRPQQPTPYELRSTYSKLLSNAMVSDTVVVKPGVIRLLFGQRAPIELQATFRVVRSPGSILTDNEIKIRVVESIQAFFDVNQWEFGEVFYFTELAAYIHDQLGNNIDTVALSPIQLSGTSDQVLMQIVPSENEIFMPDISTEQVEIVTSLVRTNIQQIGFV